MMPPIREQTRDTILDPTVEVLESRSGIRYTGNVDPEESMKDWAERMGYRPHNRMGLRYWLWRIRVAVDWFTLFAWVAALILCALVWFGVLKGLGRI